MGWLRLFGSLTLKVSFAQEPYKRDDILQKRPAILRSLLIVATPYVYIYIYLLCIDIDFHMQDSSEKHLFTNTETGLFSISLSSLYLYLSLYQSVSSI